MLAIYPLVEPAALVRIFPEVLIAGMAGSYPCLDTRKLHVLTNNGFSSLAHIPAKACPGLDPGWVPVRR